MPNRYRYLLIFSLLVAIFPSFGQNYIGLHKDEIRERVQQELAGFVFTKEISNFDRSFIKFENSFEEQTLIFMLNSDGFCTSVSRMYNTWLFNRLKDELEKRYGKEKGLIWIEMKNGKEYEVELKRGEWFITVITRVKK